MVAKVIRKVDNIFITFDGQVYTVFNGLTRRGSFTTEESAVNFSIDESKGTK